MKRIFTSWKVVLGIVLLVLSVGTGVYLLLSSNRGAKIIDGPIKIGVMTPLSGDSGSYGYPMLKGVELAKKETGRTDIEIIVEDTKCETDAALKAFPKLIEKGVIAIIGEACSGPTLALIPEIEKEHILLVSPSSTSPDLTGASKYFFRTSPSDVLQSAFGANLLIKRGYKTLGIMYTDEIYGQLLAKALENEFRDLKGKVVFSMPHDPGERDFSDQITQMMEKNPSALYIVSNAPSSGAAIIRQLGVKGYKGQIIGSDGMWANSVIRESGKNSEGLIIATTTGGNSRFVQLHKLEYGVEPGPASAQAYDAFKSIWLAIEKGATDKEDLADKMATVKFEGASGPIDFDANGDIEGTYDVFIVKNQKFVKLEN